jgi:hypothetical protein
MERVAFLTYNQIGDGIANGWHESNGRRAFVLQNKRESRWGARRNPDTPSGDQRLTDEYADRVRDEIGALWDELQGELPNLDHVVVYVGSRGSEQAIALARQLPASKVTFVACDCGLPVKEICIQMAGLAEAGRVLCECGGHHTMMSLFEDFMAGGALMPAYN